MGESNRTDSSPIAYARRMFDGDLPIAVTVDSADVISRLIVLKSELINKGGAPKLLILGGQESHLVAKELALARIPVVITEDVFPSSLGSRRALFGPPLTKSRLQVLVEAGVPVLFGPDSLGMGAPSNWRATELMQGLAWVYEVAQGAITKAEAIGLLSSHLEEALGLPTIHGEFVAWEGDPFEFGSRVRAIGTGRGEVEIYH